MKSNTNICGVNLLAVARSSVLKIITKKTTRGNFGRITQKKVEVNQTCTAREHWKKMGTYAAVAAKTSCLLALVNTDRAAEKKNVNSRITPILTPLCSGTLNKTTTGAISRATASRVMISLTNMSSRSLE